MSWTLDDLVSWLPEVVATAILVIAVGLYTAGFVDLLLGGVHYVLGSLLFATLLIASGQVDFFRFLKMGERPGLHHELHRLRRINWLKRLRFDNLDLAPDTGRLFRGSVAVYLMAYAVATYLATATPVRPTAYFGFVAVLFLVTGVQITMVVPTGAQRTVVLLELVGTHLSLAYSLSLKYYLFFGDTDALIHAWYVQYVVQSGSTIPIEGLYESFPLWHILSAELYLVTDPKSQVWKSMFLIGGVVGLLAVLGSYALARRLFADRTTPLYCALLVAANPTIVFYSAYAIPRSAIGSFVPLYLLLILYLDDIRRVAVLLGLFGATVVYHPASVQFLAPVIMVIAVLLYYTGPDSDPRWRTQIWLVGLLGVATLMYWVFQSPTLIQAIAGRIVLPSTGGGPIRTLSPETNFLQIIDRVYFGPLLALLLVGARLILRDRDRFHPSSVVLATVGLGFFFIAAPGPLSLISKLLESFAFNRWWLYVFPLVLLLCGIGLTSLRSNSPRPTGTIIFVMLLLLLLPAVSGYSVAPDNPIAETNRKAGYFTEAEVTAFERAMEFRRGNIHADYHTNRYYEVSPYADYFRPLEYNHSTRRINVESTDLVIFRRAAARDRSIRVRNERGTEIRVTASDLRNPLSSHNRVYTTGPVVAYE